ncbi:MAG: tripartite tricarboxylate transporter substrate binding protein [Burkholderiales bacterium]
MNNNKRKRQARNPARWPLLLLSFLAIPNVTGTTAWAQGQPYPVKSVRTIVPFPAGGGADFIARITVQKLSEAMGQPFIVENRAGASGNIASELVARATPDGYTLLSSSSTTVTAAVWTKTSFDVVRDFTHISTTATSCLLIAIHPSVPAKTVKDLVILAKSKPGQISYASSGAGTSPHLVGELLRQAAGVNFLHVPYKGAAPTMTALLSGEIALALPNVAAGAPLVKAGRIRVLATTCPRRTKLMPDVPTIAEAGYPNVEFVTWWGLSAPAGTPRGIVDRLNQEITRIVQSSEIERIFAKQGVDPKSMPVDELNSFVRSESSRWQKVIKQGSIDKN